MADSTINGLGAATALDGSETLPAWQGAATVKASVQQINTAVTGASGMSGATETTSKPLLNHAQTWNNAATTFTGWKLNVTNTASGGSSLLLDLQRNGSSQFSVGPFGDVSAPGGGITAFNVAGTNQLRVAGGAAWTASSSGGNTTGFWGFTAGSATAAPDAAFARKQAKIPEVNDGTAGSYAGTALVLGIQTVAQLPAAAAGIKGARATVSDATTTTFLGALTGGGANIVPVFCNGTDWVIG